MGQCSGKDLIIGLGLSILLGVEAAQAAAIQVIAVSLHPVGGGIELRLETTDSSAPQVFAAHYGRTWRADIINAQLAEGNDFAQANPAPGIESVSVFALDANSIRIAIVGQAGPPVVAPAPNDSAENSTITFTIETPNSASLSGAATASDPLDPSAEPDISADDSAPEADAPPSFGGGAGLRIVVTGEAPASDYVAPTASTATRTDTRLLDTPQSIQVIPQAVLEDQQVTRLDEALRNVSGVVVDSSEGAGFQFGLRGFQAARLLRDGFSLSGSDALSNTGILTLPEIANVERIEVLKGPASILYGEIQPGGVINLVTEQPTADPLYEVEFQLGSRGLIRPQLDFSDRLNAGGSLRYRLNALVQREDSFRDFDQSIQRTFVAPVIAWDMSDHTALIVDFEYFRDERPIDSGLLAFGNSVIDAPRDRIAGEPDDMVERDFYSGGYRLEHEFNESWSLRNAFRYSSQDYESIAFVPLDFDEASGIVNRVDSATQQRQDYYGLQTDIVGRFETGSIGHTLLFGVDLSWNISDIESRINLATQSQLDIFNPVYGNVQRLAFEEQPNPARVQDVTTSRLGIFLQDQIDLFESFKLLAGIRYDTVSQDVENSPSLFDPAGSAVSQSVDAFTPRLGLVYQPIPQLSLYASYSRSFTPSSATDLAGDLLEPEEGEGFEIGLKTELLNQKLIATLAYFDITKQNVATPDPNAPAFVNASVATGEQRSQGVELDISAEILPGWNIIANYAYTDARVTQDNVIPVGNGLAGIPEHSAGLWTTYRLQEGNLAGLGFGLGLNYVGERPGDLANSFRLDDYWITNAAIFYERNDFQLALNFKNLFNTEYIQGIPISRIRGIEPGEPFTVIGALSYRF